MAGLELHVEADPVVALMRDRGILLNATDKTVVRFVTPLIVGAAEIERTVAVLGEVLAGSGRTQGASAPVARRHWRRRKSELQRNGSAAPPSRFGRFASRAPLVSSAPVSSARHLPSSSAPSSSAVVPGRRS